MGGSSSGGGTPAGAFGSRSSSDPCNIRVVGSLQGVNKSRLANVVEGDELIVQPYPRQDSRTLGCLDQESGGLIGSLTLPAELQGAILLCIESGTKYVAQVLALDGGYCEVQVRRAR